LVQPPKHPPQATIESQGGDNSPQSCEAQFDEMSGKGDLGSNPDRDGYMAWCARNPDSASDNHCDAFEAVRKAIVDETNLAFEKQGISIRVTDVILPSANGGYCMVEAQTNVGLNVKLGIAGRLRA
jgi:hypothetical protein